MILRCLKVGEDFRIIGIEVSDLAFGFIHGRLHPPPRTDPPRSPKPLAGSAPPARVRPIGESLRLGSASASKTALSSNSRDS